MPRESTSLQPEILLRIGPESGGPIHVQVERALKDAIRSGLLRIGMPLPSTRVLARELSVLMEFLHRHKGHLEQVTGVRYSGELGHPFHVIDDEIVILCLDHPFIPEGRFASLLVRDKELATRLAEGVKELWSKAMRDIREIAFYPRS
jgi:hypothetical protein